MLHDDAHGALALHLGAVVGYADASGNTGILDLEEHVDRGQAFAVFHDWLESYLRRSRPTYLVIQRPPARRIDPDSTFITGLSSIAHMQAWAHDIPRRDPSLRRALDQLLGVPRKERKRWSDSRYDAAVGAALLPQGFKAQAYPEMMAAALLCFAEPLKLQINWDEAQTSLLQKGA